MKYYEVAIMPQNQDGFHMIAVGCNHVPTKEEVVELVKREEGIDHFDVDIFGEISEIEVDQCYSDGATLIM